MSCFFFRPKNRCYSRTPKLKNHNIDGTRPILWTLISRNHFPSFKDRTEGGGVRHGVNPEPTEDVLSELQDRKGVSGVPGHPPLPPERGLGNILSVMWQPEHLSRPSRCDRPPSSRDRIPHSVGPPCRVLPAAGAETTQLAAFSPTSRKSRWKAGHQRNLTHSDISVPGLPVWTAMMQMRNSPRNGSGSGGPQRRRVGSWLVCALHTLSLVQPLPLTPSP